MSTKTRAEINVELSCPAPLPAKDTILLGHGSGGKLSAALIRDIFLPAFQNPVLARLDDQAIVNVNGQRLAITTDSFVVKPLFFPGGDIGSLAVHGTVNDLAMGGATPLFLSAAFIIEEGFSMEELRRVVNSLQRAAAEAGVQVVTGDTKVVEKGKGDGLFINTTGIGLVPDGRRTFRRPRPSRRQGASEWFDWRSRHRDSGATRRVWNSRLRSKATVPPCTRWWPRCLACNFQRNSRHSLHARPDARRSLQHAERNRGAFAGWDRTGGKFPSYSRRGSRRVRVTWARSFVCRQRRQTDCDRGARSR